MGSHPRANRIRANRINGSHPRANNTNVLEKEPTESMGSHPRADRIRANAKNEREC